MKSGIGVDKSGHSFREPTLNPIDFNGLLNLEGSLLTKDTTTGGSQLSGEETRNVRFRDHG